MLKETSRFITSLNAQFKLVQRCAFHHLHKNKKALVLKILKGLKGYGMHMKLGFVRTLLVQSDAISDFLFLLFSVFELAEFIKFKSKGALSSYEKKELS